MRHIKIRDIPDDVILKLDDMARKNGLSRESFMRLKIQEMVMSPELNALENKYAYLISDMTEVIKLNNELLERNSSIMEELLIQLPK